MPRVVMDLPMMNTQNIKERIGLSVLTMMGTSSILIEANANGIYAKSRYGCTDDEQATYQGKNWIKGAYHDSHESPTLIEANAQGTYAKSSYGSTNDEHTTYEGKNWIKRCRCISDHAPKT
jgi:hypothetical protein